MEDNKTGVSANFGFNKPETNKDKQETIIDNKNVIVDDKKEDSIKFNDTSYDEEYTEEKKVTISLVKNYSLYRKVNDKVLPKRKDYIGSSITSSRVLSSNREEVETYFPNIIGLSPNNENFTNRVKQYLNNIKIPIDEIGRTFDVSFRYLHKKDYIKIKVKEEEIEEAYSKIDRRDLKTLKDAIKDKIFRLNILEGTKCKLGYPINVEEYIIYRHCLLYGDIAKDMSLINSDPSIRFYFKDENKEAEKLHKYRAEVNKSKVNYVTCLSDDNLFNSVYIQFLTIKGLPIISSLLENRLDREIKLDKFSTEEPVKFNKVFNDKDIKLKGVIETLIARGELIRYQYNQNIVSPEGEFIGSNLQEAVTWFNTPQNASAANAYYNRLKNI